MTERLVFKDLIVENYKIFKSFRADGFSDINIIGGENGIGKSSVLEAAFHLADRGNPTTLFHDFAWRSVPLGGGDHRIALKQLYHNANDTVKMLFASKTSWGEYNIGYTSGKQSINQPVLANTLQPSGALAQSRDTSSSFGESDGFKVSGYYGTKQDLSVVVQFNNTGLLMQANISSMRQFSQCMMLNPATRNPGPDQSVRFSTALRSGKVEKLLNFIHLVHPQISDLALLTVGGSPLLHAKIAGNNWVPLTFLGEGASDLCTIALYMINSERGIIFLDEFDSVVHHSLLTKLWRLLIELSAEMEVQIFATTHSQESLEAAVEAAEKTGSIERFKYFRLLKGTEGEIKSVSYSGEDVKNNIEEAWELR